MHSLIIGQLNVDWSTKSHQYSNDLCNKASNSINILLIMGVYALLKIIGSFGALVSSIIIFMVAFAIIIMAFPLSVTTYAS
jgi:hypothetical protein